MKKTLLTIYAVVVLLIGSVFAQDRTVNGNVTSQDDGMGIPGVSVRVTGSSVGTQTDANGNFTLTVPPTAKSLDFSFIGFLTQTVSIENRSTVDVALEVDAQQLSEVVVVGYSTTTQRA